MLRTYEARGLVEIVATNGLTNVCDSSRCHAIFDRLLQYGDLVRFFRDDCTMRHHMLYRHHSSLLAPEGLLHGMIDFVCHIYEHESAIFSSAKVDHRSLAIVKNWFRRSLTSHCLLGITSAFENLARDPWRQTVKQRLIQLRFQVEKMDALISPY